MGKLFHIAIKDILVTTRDRAALGILLAMPMVLILILGTALGGGSPEIERIDVAIINQDKGDIGTEIVDGFTESDELQKIFKTHVWQDSNKARLEVERGELAGMLVIPENFSEKVEAAEVTQLKVFTDPGQVIPTGIFRSVAGSIATRISAASIAAQTTAVVLAKSKMVADKEEVSRYVNQAVEEASKEDALSVIGTKEAESKTKRTMTAKDYYSAGMTVMFLLFGAMFGAFSFIGERTEWTLPRLLTTPAKKASIVGGKMLGIFAIGIVQFIILYVFTRLLGAYWGKSLVGVMLLAVGTVVSTTGLSILFSAIAKNRRTLGAIAPLVINIMAIAGGSMLPVEAFPQWLKTVHYFTVNGWAIDGFLDLMEGASAAAVLPNTAVLLGMGAVFFLVGVWRLRYE